MSVQYFNKCYTWIKKQWPKISIGALILMSIPLGYQIYKDWENRRLKLSVIIRPLYEKDISLCVNLDEKNKEKMVGDNCRVGQFAHIFIPIKIDLINLGSKPAVIQRVICAESICNKQAEQSFVMRLLDELPDFKKTNPAELLMKSSYPAPNIYPIVIPQNSSRTFYSILWLKISASQYEGIKFLFDLEEQGRKGCFVQKKLNLLRLSYFISMLYNLPCPECQFDLYSLLTLIYAYSFEMQNGEYELAYVVPIMSVNRLLSYLQTKIDPLSYMDKNAWNEYMDPLKPCDSSKECEAMKESYRQVGKLLDVSEYLDKPVKNKVRRGASRSSNH